MNSGAEYDSSFHRYVQSKEMVCLFGKKAVEKGRATILHCLEPMASPIAAQTVLSQVYSYVRDQRISQIDSQEVVRPPSLAILFPHEQHIITVAQAAKVLFSLLVNLHKLDAGAGYNWSLNPGISSDPHDPSFSFCLAGEAFFVPFLYQGAYAPARRSPFPTVVFNTHRAFELLRKKGTYKQAKAIIRGKEKQLFGFVPELLADYGEDLEFPQYLLPAREDLTLMWSVLHEIGGERPFG